MGRRLIEVMQVLVDQIHQGGYQHRVLEDSIYGESQKRIAAEKDRDHWKQARQEAHEAGELMQAENETLRQQLAEQQAETVDVRRQRNNETDRLNATNAVSVQQRDEIAYLQARLDEERSVSARLRQQLDATRAEVETLRQELADAQLAVSDAFAEVNSVRQQLDAANAAVTLQQGFIGKVRRILSSDSPYSNQLLGIEAAINTLDADTEPTPVAEPAPCPECERLRAEILRATRDNAKVVYGLEGKIKSLQRFAEKIRMAHHCDNWPSITMAVDELDGEFTALIESALGTEPAPVAEPLDEEGGA